MNGTTDSLKRGLKSGLLLVAVIVLASLVITAFEMFTAPNDRQKPVSKEPSYKHHSFEPIHEIVKAPVNRPTTKEIEVPADRSLTVDGYIKYGCPAPNRSWGLQDMFQARSALTTNPLLAGNNRPPLPRFESERSGKLFARITSSQNLERLRDNSIPLKNRLDFASAYAVNFASIYELYAMAFFQSEVGDSEMVEICGFYLQLASSWKELVDESLRTALKDEPGYDGYVKGAERGKAGWAIIVDLGLTILADKAHYRASERLKLLGYVKKTIPALTANSSSDLLRRVREMIEDPDQKALHDDLKSFEQIVLKTAASK